MVPAALECRWRLVTSSKKAPSQRPRQSSETVVACENAKLLPPQGTGEQGPPRNAAAALVGAEQELLRIQPLGIDGYGSLGAGGSSCSSSPSSGEQNPLVQLCRPWLPHQTRSLRWMHEREAVRDLFVCESSHRETTKVGSADPAIPFSESDGTEVALEWCMDKAFDLRGGVLCDPVGSGKTMTALGLICNDIRCGCCTATGELTPTGRLPSELQQRSGKEKTTVMLWTYGLEDPAKAVFASSWLQADATLVLCPDHVFGHC